MTTSLVLRPRWTDHVMFLYDNSSALDNAGMNMDAFAGGNFATSSCRNLIVSSAAYTSSEVISAGVGEPGTQYSPCAASQGSGGASLPYGYFGSGGYYSCQMSHPHKYIDMPTPSTEDHVSSRAKNFAFYPSYGSSPVTGYLDVPVVPAVSGPSEHKNEPSFLPAESYQAWAISANGWNAQVCSDKEQQHPGHVWKSPGPGTTNIYLHYASDPREICCAQIIIEFNYLIN